MCEARKMSTVSMHLLFYEIYPLHSLCFTIPVGETVATLMPLVASCWWMKPSALEGLPSAYVWSKDDHKCCYVPLSWIHYFWKAIPVYSWFGCQKIHFSPQQPGQSHASGMWTLTLSQVMEPSCDRGMVVLYTDSPWYLKCDLFWLVRTSENTIE